MRPPIRLYLLVLLCLLAPLPAFAQLQIHFDYTYDLSGFFSGTAGAVRRADLDAAAAVFENRMTQENFPGITPSGQNTWSLSFTDPSGSATDVINNPVLPANTITIYVGAKNLGGSTLGLSEFGYSYSGFSSWITQFDNRNSNTNFDPFGGSISFNLSSSWYFDPNPATLESFPGEYDFFSVAQHEIAHLLGFSQGVDAFATLTSGSNFVGKAAEALYGGPVPLSPDLSHWAQGTQSGGYEVTMDPSIASNQRKNFTSLDFAALQDIGYIITAIPEPSTIMLAFTGLAALAFPRLLRRRSQKFPAQP